MSTTRFRRWVWAKPSPYRFISFQFTKISATNTFGQYQVLCLITDALVCSYFYNRSLLAREQQPRVAIRARNYPSLVVIALQEVAAVEDWLSLADLEQELAKGETALGKKRYSKLKKAKATRTAGNLSSLSTRTTHLLNQPMHSITSHITNKMLHQLFQNLNPHGHPAEYLYCEALLDVANARLEDYTGLGSLLCIHRRMFDEEGSSKVHRWRFTPNAPPIPSTGGWHKEPIKLSSGREHRPPFPGSDRLGLIKAMALTNELMVGKGVLASSQSLFNLVKCVLRPPPRHSACPIEIISRAMGNFFS